MISTGEGRTLLCTTTATSSALESPPIICSSLPLLTCHNVFLSLFSRFLAFSLSLFPSFSLSRLFSFFLCFSSTFLSLYLFFSPPRMKTQLVGDIPAGLPTFSTSTIYFSYFSSLFPTALAIAIIAFLESIAISKNLASLNDYKVGGGGVV